VPDPTGLEGSNELCELNLADGRVTSTATVVDRQPHDADWKGTTSWSRS
jgi:hypothetical protein